MRALVLTAYGDVDKLELRDLPDPKAGPGEVRVRVAASSVNPIDANCAAYRLVRSQSTRAIGRFTRCSGGFGVVAVGIEKITRSATRVGSP